MVDLNPLEYTNFQEGIIYNERFFWSLIILFNNLKVKPKILGVS